MMKPIGYIAVIGLVASLALAGCGKSEKETAQTPPATPEVAGTPSGQPASIATDTRKDTIPATTQPPTTPTVAEKKPSAKPAPKKAEPKPEAPKEVMVTVPVGTSVTVSLLTHLRSDSSKAGDEFAAKTTEPMAVNETTVFPAGSEVRGHVAQAEEPHRTKGRAKLVLNVEKITAPGGRTYDVETKPIVLEGKADAVSDAGKVAIGGVAGGVLGALVSKDKLKGAAIGAAAGAAAGGGVALATKGAQLDLAPGATFGVELSKAAEIAIPAK